MSYSQQISINSIGLQKLIIRAMASDRPILNNVVASGILSNESDLDLPYIASKMQGSRLNVRKFPGLIVRKSKPKGTIILFKSNKFLLVGVNSVEQCQILAQKIAKDIKKITNRNISLQKFRITNLVANANLGYKINICSLAQEHFAYKDDKFSGVYIKTQQFKAAVVFASGKIILNGFTQMTKLQEGFQKLKQILKSFKIQIDQNNEKIEISRAKNQSKQSKRGSKKRKIHKKYQNADSDEENQQNDEQTNLN